MRHVIADIAGCDVSMIGEPPPLTRPAMSPPGRLDNSTRKRLVREVLRHTTTNTHRTATHGPRHWAIVDIIGQALADRTEDVDRDVVFLFALFHDAAFIHNRDDPGHGARGWQLATRILDGELEPDALEALRVACVEHPHGHTTDSPTIGTCWDADRLDLLRMGREPDPEFMSTDAGKSATRLAWIRHMWPPRGLAARGTGETVRLWHGTSAAFADAIRAGGIAAPAWLTSSRDAAVAYAWRRVVRKARRGDPCRHEVVFGVEMPRGELGVDSHAPFDPDQVVAERVSPERIVSSEFVDFASRLPDRSTVLRCYRDVLRMEKAMGARGSRTRRAAA
jgi:uncharacterized protein